MVALTRKLASVVAALGLVCTPESSMAAPETPATEAKAEAAPEHEHGEEAERPGGSGDAGLYVRADSDHTTVISPRLHFRKALGTEATNLDLVYTADVWSAASIDVRTAATERVTEQRDEINVGLDHEHGITLVGGGYRMSRENDYISHAVSGAVRVDAAQRNSTLEARAFGSFDFVGRSGDEYFSRRQNGTGVWLGYTQILSKIAWMQLASETRFSMGYMASPYRFVSIGSDLCGAAATFCVPEKVPERRVRQAAVLRGRIAAGQRVSFGMAYRYYIDTWQLQGHTGLGDLSILASDELLLKLEYRGYYQTGAGFYRRRYETLVPGAYYTRDRELSQTSNHRASAIAHWTKPVGTQGIELLLGVLLAGTHYRYPDFTGLDRVLALEASTSLGVGF